MNAYNSSRSRKARSLSLTRYCTGAPEFLQSLTRRTHAALPYVFESLTYPFARIGLGGDVQKTLVSFGVLHNGLGFAVNRKNQWALRFLQVLHELSRIATESGHGLNVFFDVEHLGAPSSRYNSTLKGAGEAGGTRPTARYGAPADCLGISPSVICKIMLTEVVLQNFKCFRQHTIPLRPTTIIVGRNNAGKSTIIEALRLVSLVSNRLQNLTVHEVPRWLDIPKVNRGVSPSLEHQYFDFGNVFHRYGEPPAKITARFNTGVGITIYIGGPDKIHAVIKDARRSVVITKGQARNIGLPKVGILPQIGPLQATETILNSGYVLQSMWSNLASIHFRNQLNLMFGRAFSTFKEISEATWRGLEIQELRGQDKSHGSDLELMVRNDDFVAEVGWMGHGLQMWLQTMWFLARCTGFETVILDEPDVYMHADLQRKLIRFLRGRHPQVVVATHSVEIMSEVEPENILVVDREKRQAEFTTDIPEVQKVVDQIGGIQNLQLARLWGSHRCLFVEGKDISLLKHFQNRIFPDSSDAIDAIPSMAVGGWSGWNYAVGSSMLLSTAIGQSIRSYCIFDSDFHTPNQIKNRTDEAAEKGVNLHIWSRKELENYLLLPAVISRVIARRRRGDSRLPTTEELAQKLFVLAGEFEHEVMDAFAVQFHPENRQGGLAVANRSARERMYPQWTTHEGRLSLVSGKLLLSRLSQWLQEKYGVSVSTASIAHEMRRSEVPLEIVQVLSAIEYGEVLLPGTLAGAGGSA